LRLAPSDSRCHRLKSRVELARNDVDAAIAALQREAALQPGMPDAHVAMARAHLAANRLSAAVDVLQQMWSQVPGLRRKRQEFWRLIASLAGRGDGVSALHFLLVAHEPGSAGHQIAYVVAGLLLEQGRKHSTTHCAGIPAARLHDLLAAFHASLAAPKEWPVALAVAELEVLTVPQESNAMRRGQALLRLAEGLGRAGNVWAAVRALKYTHDLSPRCPGLVTTARRIGAQFERRGDLAAAIECALVWSQRCPASQDSRERIADLRSRLAQHLALDRPATESVA